MRIRLIHFIAFFILSYNYAQNSNVQISNQRIENFNNEQGFYQNSVNAIVSDSKGYLWIATPNGLVRNYSFSIEYYYHNRENPKSLLNNYITNLLSDSSGRLWIGTRGGLCIYLTDKEQIIPLENSIKQDHFINEDSPAFKNGFENLAMNQIGIKKPALKAIAKTPIVPVLGVTDELRKKDRSKRRPKAVIWMGA